MILICTLFFMVLMTQHFRFLLFHYLNVLLILLRFNSCCQNKLISVSMSMAMINLIRSGLFQTTNDPVGGGGGFKSLPHPYDLENYFVNLHHIIQVYFTRCFKHVLIENFQKFAILTILQQFQNKK